MKRLRVSAALACAAALLAALPALAPASVQVGSSGWQWGNPLPQGNTLRAISFAGANGYALKTQSSGEILDAIRAVARGEMYLSPLISRTVVEDGLKLKRGENGQAGPCHELSPREREVFDLLVRGFSNDSIAQSLCISVKTVETHRARILKKLKLHSLVELVRFAARHDLICE